MPSNLILTQPDVVLPGGLMSAFAEQIERPALLDTDYSQGFSTRFPLTNLENRHVFRLARKLTSAQMTTLYTFLRARAERPFWFYNIRETSPIGSYDPTGANPVGRYAVVWQGSFTMVNAPGLRGENSFELREVAY